MIDAKGPRSGRREFLSLAGRAAAFGAAAGLLPRAMRAAPGRKGPPNIVVILSDDQGYADVSYNGHHPKEVRTPHTDALARRSVVCTQGYTSGHVCSPTRAGLMTGRHQQRFGVYTGGEGGSGVPLDEAFFPQHLKPAGYVCGALGKWHLGLTAEYNPVRRGFDEFYGFLGRGAHDYFDLNLADHPIYRGTTPIQDKGYLTDRITEEAVSFIRRHKERPFFLYVAYNAVHAPPQAPAEEIRKETGDEVRDTLMAMIKHLDDGVGRIVGELERAKLFDDTLLIYLTDNGGSKAMHASNAPLRGYKQQDYEGGVRVPFVVSWPKRLKGGTTCDVPVWSIDILPTALAAAGLPLPTKRPLDGRDMLPALTGKLDKLHDALFWSSGGWEGKWAVRSGKWKLVGQKDRIELFDLDADVGEAADLSGRNPEKVAELTRLHDAWLARMAAPLSGAPKRWSLAAEKDAAARANKKAQKKGDRGSRRRKAPSPPADVP
ncbi:MAG TPA: sulfatase-like hydrolase/transferase [Phycisphaerae bacterium]|nr:sulfatase-like hydrolase/transferase [Phycisphaerae bacterium]